MTDLQKNVALEEISTLQSEFNQVWDWFLKKYYQDDNPLAAACYYALQGQGKRVRPLLTLLVNQAFSGKKGNVFSGAIAVEMVHTYSLVHDDLPCLDNDDMRRGRRTVHKEFDEPTALLVGDALLTDAFQVLTRSESWLPPFEPARLDPSVRAEMVTVLAEAAGSKGMVLGQALDLHWTARNGATKVDLDLIHLNKTAKLIAAACKLGALSASATPAQITAVWEFGLKIGVAFQVLDDILDNREGTGKSKGKDLAQGKLTYLSILSREDAQDFAEELTQQAFGLIESLNIDSEPLKLFAQKLLRRQF